MKIEMLEASLPDDTPSGSLSDVFSRLGTPKNGLWHWTSHIGTGSTNDVFLCSFPRLAFIFMLPVMSVFHGNPAN